jgi:hypothetical protein
MDYEIGQTGRVVVMRLHDGDPIYSSIESVAEKERIGSAAIGKGEAVIAGCPRKGADCWLVDEVIMLEIIGTTARRSVSEQCGLELLSFSEK